MALDPSIEEIIQYPIDPTGALVTRDSGLARMKPKLNAPPASQPGSVDWTMTTLFGNTVKAIAMIESLVAGQGENADPKWVRFLLLYKKWQIQYSKGDILEPPTLNQVCHSLDFDAQTFITELQSGIQSLMRGIAHMKASLAVPDVINNLTDRAKSADGDTKDIELHLKIAGVIDEKGGFNVQINNTQNQAVMLKSEREAMKSPLRQFSDTVTRIDDEVRKTDD